MSPAQRLGLVGLAAVVAAAAFVILRPEEDTTKPAPGTGEAPAGTSEGVERYSGREGDLAREPPDVEIRVEGGRPVGGLRTISSRKGDTVRLEVRSDGSEEVHVHGYDLSRRVTPGSPARFAFTAELEGVFEIELEGAREQIARLKVEP